MDITQAPPPTEVFLVYHEEDKRLREKINTHLSALRRQKVIATFRAGNILAEEAEKTLLTILGPDQQYTRNAQSGLAAIRAKLRANGT